MKWTENVDSGGNQVPQRIIKPIPDLPKSTHPNIQPMRQNVGFSFRQPWHIIV
jgi:hypothetical protein